MERLLHCDANAAFAIGFRCGRRRWRQRQCRRGRGKQAAEPTYECQPLPNLEQFMHCSAPPTPTVIAGHITQVAFLSLASVTLDAQPGKHAAAEGVMTCTASFAIAVSWLRSAGRPGSLPNFA